MALTDILDQIKKEAEKKIEELKKDFEDKKTKLEKEQEDKQKEIDGSIHERVEIKSKRILEKAENLAQQEAANALLKAKRQVLEDAFEKAIEALKDSDKYEDILTSMLKKANIEGDDTVVIPAQGKEEQTKNAIKNSGKSYFLSEKSTDIKGGFILKTSTVEIDNSFETIIKEQLRDDLEIKINKSLF